MMRKGGHVLRLLDVIGAVKVSGEPKPQNLGIMWLASVLMQGNHWMMG